MHRRMQWVEEKMNKDLLPTNSSTKGPTGRLPDLNLISSTIFTCILIALLYPPKMDAYWAVHSEVLPHAKRNKD